MAKSIFEELTSYRVKIEREGKEIVNVPGILVLPIALAAPKASIIETIAAPILGCSIHVENENGNEIDVGKAVKAAADTVIDTAKTAAKTIKEEVDKAWDELSADDPEGCPEGTEKDEASGDGKDAEDDIPTIQINPDDSEKE